MLEASFEAHVSQDIPQAHNYEPPSFDIDLYIPVIIARLKVEIKPTLELIAEINARLELTINGIELHIGSDYTTVHKYKQLPSSLTIDGIFQSDVLTISVADGETQDTAQIMIPIPDIRDGVDGKDGRDGRDGVER